VWCLSMAVGVKHYKEHKKLVILYTEFDEYDCIMSFISSMVER
jgi:hypothetical protein